MTPHLSPLDRIMRGSGPLEHLRRSARLQQALLERVRTSLPDALAGHCVAAVLQGDRLTLFADSPAWGSRLRFMAPRVAGALRGEGPTVRTVKVRVLPASAPPPPRSRPPARLSASSARILDQVAGDISDPGLRAALERLARRGTRE